jgi:RNA polymerase sigma-70 factor (ECF subfamily)
MTAAAAAVSLDRLYREHGHAVLRRARRMLRSDDDARDVVQDVFLDLHKHPDRFEARSSIATYLYAAATHACLNRIRDGKTRTRLIAVETTPQAAPATSDTRALALEILAGLSDEEAALAIYLYCDELTHDEIAGLLGCSRRHVGDLALRLRRRIMERVA